MAERLLPRLWVLLLAVLLVTLERPGGFLDLSDRAIFDRWVNTFHPRDTLAPWPPELVAVGIDTADIARFRGDSSSLFLREHAVVIWDRLHELGAKVVVNDFQFVTRREQEVDDAVVAALRRDAVILPIGFTDGSSVPVEAARESLESAQLDVPDAELRVYPEKNLQPPLPEFANAANGLGHVLVESDRDGSVRRLFAAIRVGQGGRALPFIGVVALARVRGADLTKLRIEEDRLLLPGLPPMPLDGGAFVVEMPRRLDDPPAVKVSELLDRTKDAELRAKIDGKIALVFTQGRKDVKRSALALETPGGLLLAHGIRTLAAGHAPTFPPRGPVFLLLLAAVLLGAGAALRLKPASIAVLGLCGAVTWGSLQIGVYRAADVFLPLIWPMLFLASSGLAIAIHKSLVVVRRMEMAEARADAGKAPRGEIALVFTDVQGSTLLWDRIPGAMRSALDLHNALLRKRIEVWRGYEVKTEGDAFMIAFGNPADALGWCLDVQTRLLAEAWPPELLEQPDGALEESTSGALLWRGLRVRMGIHVGSPEPKEDPKTGRMDYFGPVVNKAARVSSMAHGGQVLASGTAWEKLAGVAASIRAATKSIGTFALKGIATPEPLEEILAEGLAGRRFPPPKSAAASQTGEHSVA